MGITAIEFVKGSAPLREFPDCKTNPMQCYNVITTQEPPRLSEQHSKDMRVFVRGCLRMAAAKRVAPTDLLHANFLQRYPRGADLLAGVVRCALAGDMARGTAVGHFAERTGGA